MAQDQIQKYAYIDALRGVAILLVVFVHTSFKIPDLSSKVADLASYGQMGVQLFFVLSALTLCFSFESRKHEEKPIFSFYVRRYFRIAPLYYFALFFYMLLGAVVTYQHSGAFTPEEKYSAQNVMLNLLFVHDVFPAAQNGVVPGGWSIGVEMLFYAVFPWLMFYFRMFRYKLLASAFLILIFLTTGFLVSHVLANQFGFTMTNNEFIYLLIFNQLPVFAVGLFTYFLISTNSPKLQSTPIFWLSILMFAAFTYLSLLVWHSNTTYAFVLVPLIAAASFAALIIFVSQLHYIPQPLQRIGELSYAIYIVHFLTMRILRPEILDWTNKHVTENVVIQLFSAFIFNVALACILATVVSKFIEAPGIRAGKKIIAYYQAGQKKN
jgi:peptidoglycan/LPS O-acetylase OafA/YrhL